MSTSTPSKPQSAVIIGAGVAGLATAALLAKDGIKVTVVERNDATGGRAGNLVLDEAPGYRWDTGPSWYLMPEAFDHFFELMGTSTAEQYELADLSPAYRLYPEGGAPIDLETGKEEVSELFESLEPGAGARVERYLDSASDAYFTALDHFLYTTFKDPRKLVHGDIRSRAGRLGSLLSKNLRDYVGNQFDDHRIQQVLTYPAVFLSTQPSKAPALYSLMSHTDLVEGVRYPRGGFAAVVAAIDALAREAGVEIITGADATAILTEATGATGISAALAKAAGLANSALSKVGVTPASAAKPARATGVRVHTPEGVRDIHADVVVSAADLHHTETALLPPELRTYPESYWAKRDPGLGTVLIFMGVEGELPELAHHTLMFSKEWDADFKAVYEGPEPSRPLGSSRSIYISRTSATDDDAAPEGHENLFVLIPVPPAEGVGQGDAYAQYTTGRVEAIADAAIEQIGQWAGIDNLAERVVVKRTLGPADFANRYNAWSGGSIGPAHTLAQSAFLRGANTSAKVDGLYYAGATTVPGVGVPMCLISAENILKRIHGDTSTGPLESLDALPGNLNGGA